MRGVRFVAEMSGDRITEQNIVYAATSSHHAEDRHPAAEPQLDATSASVTDKEPVT